ncbi:hypothetical protein N7520_011776 [Penicillium odoratum]|uniref:uncharacterized protein n=1 Tax=Penicillium odoratum TaxID=1167516 RepID=UPI0025486336|nr:uncharacterized protein N7520_011776 [Penicillium odoratum]KAJ5746594.1 hypothetical protein N7520_011776 [Penicillium odoratum]
MPTNCSPKRACDQCHALKEKCRRTNATSPCQRCSRLGQTCEITRDIAKAGRKPRGTRKLSYTLPQFSIPIDSDPSLDVTPYNAGLASNPVIFSDLDQWERHFLNLMKKDSATPSPLEKFLVSPSFHESHHISFIQNLIQPTPELKNASVACAAVLFGDQSPERAKTVSDIGHKRAALAVSSLRSFQLCDKRDLTTILVLSVAMVTFAMHVENGQHCLIARYTLSLIKSQAQSFLDFESPMMDFLMCLVSTETFECLLKSRPPTWRIDTSRRGNSVDRYLGLSYPLFCHFFDICEMATLLRCGEKEKREVMIQLRRIYAAIEKWHPLTPVDFLQRFTQAEVVALLAQARILQLAGLLIIHRLRFPFGQCDGEAQMLSQAIIYQFDSVIQLTGRSVPCTFIPYLAACFEILGDEPRNRALAQSLDIITFSKQAQIKFKDSLTSIWKARDYGEQFYWFELGKYLSEHAAASK